MTRPLLTLTTDFGNGSPYVAQMKGVMLSICREMDVIDITHAIRPQSIREGAVVLADAAPRFPPGTIHVAVVDPGVGTSRRIVYAKIGEQRYVAPDNGLLSRLAEQQQPLTIIALENKEYWLAELSSTFHGRDIMAPVAGHLARGLDPKKLGPAGDDLVRLTWPPIERSSDAVTGEVLYIDSFGNLITNIQQNDLTTLGHHQSVQIECAGHTILGIVPTYGAALAGEFIALFDSQGRLEIASVGGNAASVLQAEIGDDVRVVQV